MSKKPLFESFLPVSAKEWKQKIQYDLKGADYNESLVWESPEGIKVKPFYHADDAIKTSENLIANSGWYIGQSIYVGNTKMANNKGLKAIASGAESLSFSIPSDEINIAQLLNNIDVNTIPVHFNMEFLAPKFIASVLDFTKGKNDNIFLNVDAIAQLARNGNWFENFKEDFTNLKEILHQGFKNSLSIDIGLYQNAGANMVQQLAYGLAHANEYLNAFASEEELKTITFKVALGSNYFFEIAKLRALRKLWMALVKEYSLKIDCHIIAIPTKRNKTLYDYNTNMLRTTTATMAAVMGGADTVVNMAYDAIYHKDNDFGERIALNQLLLLKNESYLDKVGNPADGSYYIENITNQLAEKALILFKSIEHNGGFLKQLKAHVIQRKIEESAQKEQVKFEAGEEILVGTNKYQNEKDVMKETIELYPFLKTNPRKTLIQPILEKRLSEGMEQKRLNDE